MIELEIGKAIVPVEQTADKKGTCDGCVFWDVACHDVLACMRGDRKDDKDVIFKLVDYKVEP